MLLGYVQFQPALCDLDTTLERLSELLPECRRADLVVLPELCNSGYAFDSRSEALGASEPVAESKFLAFLHAQCREHDLHIVTGMAERAGDVVFNSAIATGPDGVVARYRKLHLFGREKDWFEPGDLAPSLVSIRGVRVGMMVCFDWAFPEVWRALALRGADVVCHPANLVIPAKAQRAVATHAMVNHYFVVTANRYGKERELEFTGRSQIAGPDGEVLVAAEEVGDAVAIVDVDPTRSRDKWITPRNHLLGDRREEYYGEVAEPAIVRLEGPLLESANAIYESIEFVPSQPDDDTFGILRRDQLIALAHVQRHGDGAKEFGGVWTHPRHRRSGIARRLVAHVLEGLSAGQTYWCVPFSYLSEFYLGFGMRRVDCSETVPQSIANKVTLCEEREGGLQEEAVELLMFEP